MATKDVKRKLRAILSADVQGYSRLMGDDEVGTVKTITEYREILTSLVNQYNGRVVDSPGDNVLAEFGSVVDAVQCAVEIQNILKAKNEELPENRRMIFRIGVNLGDVIQEGDRIYGDGVNIAARIESLAEGGGICISGTAYDHIENKLALGYNFIGEHSVKNIAKPVRVYKVPMEPGERKGKRVRIKKWQWTALAGILVLILAVGAWAIWNFYFRPPPMEPASVEKMAYPLPDKPSIAVLPFENLSDDPSQENIVDGITDAIITGLSKTPEMFVIARNSVFTYKGKPVKVKQVSEELGVRYVLEGSVQKEGDRLRINAQLIDAIKGHHLWAEKYDRGLKDLFALQDEITMKIIQSLQVKLTEGEYARVLAKGTNNLEAYLKCLQAIQLSRRLTKDDDLQARKIYKEAIALDPNYATPYAYMGSTYRKAVTYGWSKSPKDDLARAGELIRKAIELDNSLGLPHRFLADIHRGRKQWDKAIEEMERGVSIDPNPQTMYGLAYTLFIVGRHEESIALFKKAFRLDPLPPAMYIWLLGNAYFLAERYEEALAEYKRALRKGGFSPKMLHRDLAATYAMLGQEDKARHHVAEVLKIDPKFSLKRVAKRIRKFYKNEADADLWINAYRKAGLPENPLLPPAPEKPSIAVLPFANISGDPKEDYLSDGITEQIITALSKIPRMLVIARNSVFTYKGKPVMVQQVSEELGVRYVLEGSVQKSGEKLRITAQLIDAKTGNHIWADRYDRELRDLFALQDEITMRIIEGLRVKLTAGQIASALGKSTRNLEAYLKVMKGAHHFQRVKSDDNEIARQFFEEAIELDSKYSSAYMFLGWTYNWEAFFRWTKKPAKSYEKAVELAKKAISLNGQNPGAYGLLANTYVKTRQFEKAIAAANKSLSLEPSNAQVNFQYGNVLFKAGKGKEAIPFLKKAIRLNPKYPGWSPFILGWAYFRTGQNEKAVTTFRKDVSHRPKYALAHASLGCALIAAGKLEEAIAMFEQALNLSPDGPSWCIGDLAIARLGAEKPEESFTTMQDLVSRRPDDADAYRCLSQVLLFEGKYQEALSMAKKAVSLEEMNPSTALDALYYMTLGSSYLMMRQYEEAIAAFKKAIDSCSECIYSHIGLTASYSLAGRMEDARAQAAEVLKINPKITLEDIAENGYYNYKRADKDRFINALRKAGLK